MHVGTAPVGRVSDAGTPAHEADIRRLDYARDRDATHLFYSALDAAGCPHQLFEKRDLGPLRLARPEGVNEQQVVRAANGVPGEPVVGIRRVQSRGVDHSDSVPVRKG